MNDFESCILGDGQGATIKDIIWFKSENQERHIGRLDKIIREPHGETTLVIHNPYRLDGDLDGLKFANVSPSSCWKLDY